MLGIVLRDVHNLPGEAPLVVQRCRIYPVNYKGPFDGITLAGTGSAPPRGVRGVALRDNQVAGAFRGIFLQGAVSDVQVTGNVSWNCHAAALQIQELAEASAGILLANNTCFACQNCFRVFDYPPVKQFRPGQVELCNNLLLEPNGDYDMGFTVDRRDG